MTSNLGVNRVFLIGNAGQDAEVRVTSSGKSVANFSLAINQGLRDKSGKSGRRVDWVRCLAWNKLADIVGNHVKKGRQVFVEGRLQTRQYRDGEGTERTSYEVVVATLRVLSGERPTRPSPSKAAASPEAPAQTETEDIPF